MEIWQEYRTLLHANIAKRVPDRDTAEDIVQDVLLKAYAGLHTVKTRGSITPWLYRIAANAIADYYRSRKQFDEVPENLTAPEAERDPIAELACCLQLLIDEVPEKYRSALMLSEIQGLKQQQVADKLGLSLSGAKSRVQRGREKLRERLHLCCEIEVGKHGVVDYRPRPKKCDSSCS
ncbi:MAG: RNA polymerase sigma factor SigZ [Gammaproteobacteria bacterium]|nr:RNA polymerase sigma factor SigZ [Gammaproteobacteria bacterium]